MRVIKRTIKAGQKYYECGRKDNEFRVVKVSRSTGYVVTLSNRPSKFKVKPSKIKLSRLADTRYYKLID